MSIVESEVWLYGRFFNHEKKFEKAYDGIKTIFPFSKFIFITDLESDETKIKDLYSDVSTYSFELHDGRIHDITESFRIIKEYTVLREKQNKENVYIILIGFEYSYPISMLGCSEWTEKKECIGISRSRKLNDIKETVEGCGLRLNTLVSFCERNELITSLVEYLKKNYETHHVDHKKLIPLCDVEPFMMRE